MFDILLLSLFTLTLGRYIFPLHEGCDPLFSQSYFSTRKSKYLVLLFFLFLSFFSLLSQPVGDSSVISRVLTGIIGFLWIYSFLPSRDLPACLSNGFLQPNGSRKLVLLLLYLVSIWAPSFFIIFYGLCFFVFRERFKFISNAEVYLPYNASTALTAYHCAHIFRPIDDSVFVIFFIVLVGFHYWPSGVDKFKNNWDKINFLPNIVAGANMQNNWGLLMRPFSFRAFSSINFIVQPLVVFAQCTAVFSIIDFRFCIIVFSFLILIHLFVFISTGIFFWKWILCLAAGISILCIKSPPLFIPALQLDFVFIFVISLVCAYLLGNVPTLSWLDSPLVSKTTILVQKDEHCYEVNPYDLAPLDMHFSQGRIGTCYPSDECNFTGCFGALNHTDVNTMLLSELNKLSNDPGISKDQVLSLLRAHQSYDKGQSAPFFDANNFLHLILDRLRDLLKPQGLKKYFPNYHIWNLRPRDNPQVLKDDLVNPLGLRFILKRRVYFFHRATMDYIQVHESQHEFKRS